MKERFREVKLDSLIALFFVFPVLASGGCGRESSSPKATSVTTPSSASLPASRDAGTRSAVHFLEDRVRSDPDDIVALNKLAAYYLQLDGETGDARYLELASRTANASLSVLPAEQNLGGLTILTQIELATHQFASARDHARLLTQYEPRKTLGYQFLSDALIELGDYDHANAVLDQMHQLGGATIATETRFAHLALLRGDHDAAARRYTVALKLAQTEVPSSDESVAWCHTQLGEMAFARGDYQKAEQHYRDALKRLPDYSRAVYLLARVRAAQHDLTGAIKEAERAVELLPEPIYVASVGDLYRLAGREKEAMAQYDRFEQLASPDQPGGSHYSRHLAVFRADHDVKVEEAYASAKKDYETRRDIYGADALAWTALKAGKIPEAKAAISEALRLGTRDARLFYHAGMIARAEGDKDSARDYLQRALQLNPQFDPLQAAVARNVLENLLTTKK